MLAVAENYAYQNYGWKGLLSLVRNEELFLEEKLAIPEFEKFSFDFVQDNKVKFSFIGNIATIFINVKLRTTQTITSNIDKVSDLDACLHVVRDFADANADGHIQMLI